MPPRHDNASFTTYFRRSKEEGQETFKRGRKGTKIIGTLGPASENEETIRKLMKAGLNVVRMNMSHGSHEDHQARLDLVRKVSRELNRPVAVLADLQGPKIRTGEMPEGGVNWPDGHEGIITVADCPVGSSERIGTGYKLMANDVEPGNTILIDDGKLRAIVQKVDGDDIHVRMANGGIIKSRKGINLPDVNVSAPALSDKDKDDLKWAIQAGVDYVALSFVSTEDDIHMLRRRITDAGAKTPIIAKIERPEAVERVDAILEAADGIMVARGDLAIEIDTERMPVVQKHLISRANAAGKLVITATQMLESMIDNPVPTRAETNDVANAIFDGSDAVMLSGETAAGKYPVDAVMEMAQIAIDSESSPYMPALEVGTESIAGSKVSLGICRAAGSLSSDIEAQGIMAFSHGHSKATALSKMRNKSFVVCCCYDEATWRRLSLFWGIIPILIEFKEDQHDLIEAGIAEAKKLGLYKTDDQIVIIIGYGKDGANAIRVVRS